MACPDGYIQQGAGKCSKVGAYPPVIIDEPSGAGGFDWSQIPEWIKVIGGVTSSVILAKNGVGTPAPVENNYYQNQAGQASATSTGFPWWGWALIIGFAVIALVAIFANMNKKAPLPVVTK